MWTAGLPCCADRRAYITRQKRDTRRYESALHTRLNQPLASTLWKQGAVYAVKRIDCARRKPIG